MDGSDLQSLLGPCTSSLGDPSKKAWSLRNCEGDVKERPDAPQSIEICDQDSVLHSEGIRTSNVEFSMESVARMHHHKEEGTSQIQEEISSVISDRLVQVTAGHSEGDAACLSLGHAGSGKVALEDNKDNRDICFAANPNQEHDPHFLTSKGVGADLNTANVSECGSTTGPLEESESLRKWKEMKKNGFLSSSHGGIPLPKQCGRQSRKRKCGEIKMKAKAPKCEQVHRFAELAAPSGLLSRLDPGIIKHVRNCKQVHSIIEAMVLSEKQNGQIQMKSVGQLGIVGSKKTDDRSKDQNRAVDLATNQLALTIDRPPVTSSSGQGKISESEIDGNRFHHGTSISSQFTSEYDDDTLALKLSSTVTMVSDNANSASSDDFSANQENIASLSLKAATVASQWLELLQLDIKGRLAALRRSKKRVRNVIQTELHYLTSRELTSNVENDPCTRQWRSLFSQMDIALYDEAKHLESSLRQVQDIQIHCEKGLKFVGADCLSQLGSSEASRLRKPGDMECAVMAAAASIYSTCNLIMTKENLPCF